MVVILKIAAILDFFQVAPYPIFLVLTDEGLSLVKISCLLTKSHNSPPKYEPNCWATHRVSLFDHSSFNAQQLAAVYTVFREVVHFVFGHNFTTTSSIFFYNFY